MAVIYTIGIIKYHHHAQCTACDGPLHYLTQPSYLADGHSGRWPLVSHTPPPPPGGGGGGGALICWTHGRKVPHPHLEYLKID